MKEIRFIFEPGDIEAIRLTCREIKKARDCEADERYGTECGGVTLYLPKKHKRPSRCSRCGEDWSLSDENYAPILRFMEQVRTLQRREGTLLLGLQIEIDGKETGDGQESTR